MTLGAGLFRSVGHDSDTDVWGGLLQKPPPDGKGLNDLEAEVGGFTLEGVGSRAGDVAPGISLTFPIQDSQPPRAEAASWWIGILCGRRRHSAAILHAIPVLYRCGPVELLEFNCSKVRIALQSIR